MWSWCDAGAFLFFFFFCVLLNSVNQHIQLGVQTLPSICCDCEVSPEQDGRASGADDAIAGVQGVQPDTLYRDLVDLKAQRGDPLNHQGELMAAEVGNYKQAHTSSLPLTKGKRDCAWRPAHLPLDKTVQPLTLGHVPMARLTFWRLGGARRPYDMQGACRTCTQG